MDEQILTPRRLYRSRDDRMIAGVAGGLAHYFNLDPVLVRLAFVLFGVGTGIGLIAYIVLAIVVPERPLDEPEPVITSTLETSRGREVAGYVLLAFGALFLASNLGIFGFLDWGRLWPLLLVGAGVALLINRSRD